MGDERGAAEAYQTGFELTESIMDQKQVTHISCSLACTPIIMRYAIFLHSHTHTQHSNETQHNTTRTRTPVYASPHAPTAVLTQFSCLFVSDHFKQLVGGYTNLAHMWADAGEADRAETYLLKALTTQEKLANGTATPALATALENIADFYEFAVRISTPTQLHFLPCGSQACFLCLATN